MTQTQEQTQTQTQTAATARRTRKPKGNRKPTGGSESDKALRATLLAGMARIRLFAGVGDTLASGRVSADDAHTALQEVRESINAYKASVSCFVLPSTIEGDPAQMKRAARVLKAHRVDQARHDVRWFTDRLHDVARAASLRYRVTIAGGIKAEVSGAGIVSMLLNGAESLAIVSIERIDK